MESWKASLLDLSIDNPLIDAFGLELTAEPIALAAALAAGGGLAIEAGAGGLAEGKLSAQLAPAELQRELIALRREAASSPGEHTLWIALGTLTMAVMLFAPVPGRPMFPVISASAMIACAVRVASCP